MQKQKQIAYEKPQLRKHGTMDNLTLTSQASGQFDGGGAQNYTDSWSIDSAPEIVLFLISIP